MDNATRAADLASIAERVGESLVEDFGGFLRCETCRRSQTLDSEQAGRYMGVGWPQCCGHTMHWWTQRQADAGEVPA